MEFISVLSAAYFLLPAYVANMAPVFVAKGGFLQKPMDGGATWRNKPLLGSHKTWGGLIAGTLAGVLMVLLQVVLSTIPFFDRIGVYAYAWNMPTLLLGICLGAGALLGDALASFFKRRVGIPSGKPWIPFDQTDFALGAFLFSSIIFFPGWAIVLIGIVLSFALHLLVDYLAYLIGLRDTPI